MPPERRSTGSRRPASSSTGSRDEWASIAGDGFVLDGGAVVAWRGAPDAPPSTGFQLVGAHTDSPCLRIKPRPDDAAYGWRQLNVEVYGGILNNSWLDRDLGIAGRLTLAERRDGARQRRPPRRPRPAARRASRSHGQRIAQTRPTAAPATGLGCWRLIDRRVCRMDRRCGRLADPDRSGTCACTTCNRRRCSAPTSRCWRPDGSTINCRVGRR